MAVLQEEAVDHIDNIVQHFYANIWEKLHAWLSPNTSFVAENLVYQNKGEVDSNISPEYLKTLVKTALLLLIATLTSYVPIIAVTLTIAISSFANYCFISKITLLTKVITGVFSKAWIEILAEKVDLVNNRTVSRTKINIINISATISFEIP